MSLARLKARLVFYPTLWWNMLLGRVLRFRNWWDRVGEHILLGAMPFKRDVSRMFNEGVDSVVNTCEEYAGPVDAYEEFGIKQFRMPTTDFTHPRIEDVERAVEFMDQRIANGGTVYVHCKAGRARSATVVMCWLIKNRQQPATEIQTLMNRCRSHINQRLTERPVVQEFERRHLKAKQADASEE